MTRKLIVILHLCASLQACSASHELLQPDGRSRVPANSQQAIAEYNAMIDEQRSKPHGTNTAMRGHGSAGADSAEIQGFLAHGAVKDTVAVEAARASSSLGSESSSNGRNGVGEYAATEGASILAVGAKQLCRYPIRYAPGSAAFEAPTYISKALLRDALEGDEIHIVGSTDAIAISPAAERLARSRAESARRFLLDSGITQALMTGTIAFPADFVGDNARIRSASNHGGVEIDIVKTAPCAISRVAAQAKEES